MWWLRLGQKLKHVHRGVNEDDLVVILSDNGSLRRRIHIVKQNQVFDCLDWLARGVREVQLDVDRELAPADFVDSERRCRHRDHWLWEAWIQLKLYFADPRRDVFVIAAPNVATPGIDLVLGRLFAAKDGICSENDRFVN